ncbi:hypothetical protein NDU88_001626 [Pleurodeles waltl]|uniref:Uncharacterized protein n=1 Tax=Pleurodeles waltl TaxID=8319 RepID=A0AAV7U914_PLEWA|nr:hypothetical protein NDU88_001626 [Pleurodeles waltl]
MEELVTAGRQSASEAVARPCLGGLNWLRRRSESPGDRGAEVGGGGLWRRGGLAEWGSHIGAASPRCTPCSHRTVAEHFGWPVWTGSPLPGGSLPQRERRSGSTEVPRLGARDGPATLICRSERHVGDSRGCIDPAAQEPHWTRGRSPDPGV